MKNCLCPAWRWLFRAAIVCMLVALAPVSAQALRKPVEANSADALALMDVPGIGSALAAQIVVARRQGAFSDWVDLMRRVPGVRDARAANLAAAGLTVNGLPYAHQTRRKEKGSGHMGSEPVAKQ